MLFRSSGEPLRWSWGVDFYHACEYVSKLAASLFGSGEAASSWAAKQRQTLRTKVNGVGRVIQRAAQQRRRRGLKGTKKDFASAINYLKTYRVYMDFAAGRRSDRQRDYRGGLQSDFQSAFETIGNALATRDGTIHCGPANGSPRRAVALDLATTTQPV